MARRCVFCGGGVDSQEHVWPDWAAPLLAHEGALSVVKQVAEEGGPTLARSYKKAAFSETVGVVCSGCNNGWMCVLEEEAKPYLEPMFHGRPAHLRRSAQRTLAAWALKTAMMGGHAHGAARTAIPPQECVFLYEHGEPSERVRIWMASYEGVDLAGTVVVNGIDINLSDEKQPGRGWRDIWTSTVTFGPVVFQVFGTTVDGLLHRFGTRDKNTHVLLPYRAPFTWVPKPGFSDAELLAFADGLIAEVRRDGESSVAIPQDYLRMLRGGP